MKTIAVLYARLMRLGISRADAQNVCGDAKRQIRKRGSFAVHAAGGWIFGSLTPHGVQLGSGPAGTEKA